MNSSPKSTEYTADRTRSCPGGDYKATRNIIFDQPKGSNDFNVKLNSYCSGAGVGQHDIFSDKALSNAESIPMLGLARGGTGGIGGDAQAKSYCDSESELSEDEEDLKLEMMIGRESSVESTSTYTESSDIENDIAYCAAMEADNKFPKVAIANDDVIPVCERGQDLGQTQGHIVTEDCEGRVLSAKTVATSCTAGITNATLLDEEQVVTGDLHAATGKTTMPSTVDRMSHARTVVFTHLMPNSMSTLQRAQLVSDDSPPALISDPANDAVQAVSVTEEQQPHLRDILLRDVDLKVSTVQDDTVPFLLHGKGDSVVPGQSCGDMNASAVGRSADSRNMPSLPILSTRTDGTAIAAGYGENWRQVGTPKRTLMDKPLKGWQKEIFVMAQGDELANPAGVAIPRYVPPGHSAPILHDRADVVRYLERNSLPQCMLDAFDFQPLFCICHREKNFFLYIECSANIAGCGGWFHASCAGWADSELEEQSKLYMAVICPLCSNYVLDTPYAKTSLYIKLCEKLRDERENFSLTDATIQYRIQTGRVMWLINDGKYYVTTGLDKLPSLLSTPERANMSQEIPTYFRIDKLDLRSYIQPHHVWGEVRCENADARTDTTIQRNGGWFLSGEQVLPSVSSEVLPESSCLLSCHTLTEVPTAAMSSTPVAGLHKEQDKASSELHLARRSHTALYRPSPAGLPSGEAELEQSTQHPPRTTHLEVSGKAQDMATLHFPSRNTWKPPINTSVKCHSTQPSRTYPTAQQPRWTRVNPVAQLSGVKPEAPTASGIPAAQSPRVNPPDRSPARTASVNLAQTTSRNFASHTSRWTPVQPMPLPSSIAPQTVPLFPLPRSMPPPSAPVRTRVVATTMSKKPAPTFSSIPGSLMNRLNSSSMASSKLLGGKQSPSGSLTRGKFSKHLPAPSPNPHPTMNSLHEGNLFQRKRNIAQKEKISQVSGSVSSNPANVVKDALSTGLSVRGPSMVSHVQPCPSGVNTQAIVPGQIPFCWNSPASTATRISSSSTAPVTFNIPISDKEKQLSCGPEILKNWCPENIDSEGWFGDLGPSVADIELQHQMTAAASALRYSSLDPARFDDYARRYFALAESHRSTDHWANSEGKATIDDTNPTSMTTVARDSLVQLPPPSAKQLSAATESSSSSASISVPTVRNTLPSVCSESELQRTRYSQADSTERTFTTESSLGNDCAGRALAETNKIPWVCQENLEISEDMEENDIRIASIPTSVGSEEKKYVYVSIRGGWTEYEDISLYTKERRRCLSKASAVEVEVRVKSELINHALKEIDMRNERHSRMTKKQINAAHGLSAPLYAQIPLNDGGMTLTTLIPGTLLPLQHYCLSKCAICFNPLRGTWVHKQADREGDNEEVYASHGRRSPMHPGGKDEDADDDAAATIYDLTGEKSGGVNCERLRTKRSATDAKLLDITRSKNRFGRTGKHSSHDIQSQVRMLGILRCRIHNKCWDLYAGKSLQKSLDHTVSSDLISLGEVFAYNATDLLTCDLCGRCGGAIFGFTIHESVHIDVDVCDKWMGHWPCILFLAHSGMLCTDVMLQRCRSQVPWDRRARRDTTGNLRLENVHVETTSPTFAERLNKYRCSLCDECIGLTVECNDPTCSVVAHHLCAMLGGWGIHCIQETSAPLFHCPYHFSNVHSQKHTEL